MPQGARFTHFLICRLNSRGMCHTLCTHHSHAPHRSSAGTALFCLNSIVVKAHDYTSQITCYRTLFPDSSREYYCTKEGNKTKVTAQGELPETWTPRNFNINIKLIFLTKQETPHHVLLTSAGNSLALNYLFADSTGFLKRLIFEGVRPWSCFLRLETRRITSDLYSPSESYFQGKYK